MTLCSRTLTTLLLKQYFEHLGPDKNYRLKQDLSQGHDGSPDSALPIT